MRYQRSHYRLLAEIFTYPGTDFTEKVRETTIFLQDYLPDAALLFQPFSRYISSISILDQQELFIRSFEVQAITTLDLGYVLFGDDYKRGELLVNLNREHREAGNDCGVELADHLSNVLHLMSKLSDETLLEELARRIVWSALKRMIRGFEPEQIELKDKFYFKKHKSILERPEQHYPVYVSALKMLYRVLQYDFGFQDSQLPEHVSDFLKNLHTEVKLDDL